MKCAICGQNFDAKDKCKNCGWNILSPKNINNAQHSSRKKAIHILENIAEKMGNEDMFDGILWYELEDMITYMIEGAEF